METKKKKIPRDQSIGLQISCDNFEVCRLSFSLYTNSRDYLYALKKVNKKDKKEEVIAKFCMGYEQLECGFSNKAPWKAIVHELVTWYAFLPHLCKAK